MPRYLVTCPGRHGDILWALPSARALCDATGTPVDLLVSGKYHAVVPLALEQPYIRSAFWDDQWVVAETAPMTPWQPPRVPEGYDGVAHLGYREWPTAPLPYAQYSALLEQLPPMKLHLDPERPWLLGRHRPAAHRPHFDVAVAFTDEWIELKAGALLSAMPPFSGHWCLVVRRESRWWHEYLGAFRHQIIVVDSYSDLADRLYDAAVVLADCSAPHVIACGVGRPVVLLEPATARHHPIFYPYGWDGPEVTLVKGSDGQPTFDARHLRDALLAAVATARP